MTAWLEPATANTRSPRRTRSGITALTVTHDLDGAPKTAAQVAGTTEAAAGGGGWSWVLSDLKTLLETGKSLAG